MGFNLFTLLVKFNIRDNVHPLSRSWNSSSDARIGDDMLFVPLAQIGVSVYLAVLCNYALIRTFIFHRELTVERCVYFYTTVSFYSVSHSRTTSL